MPKPIAYDVKIPNGKIKGTLCFNSLRDPIVDQVTVLSRTLFVGGVSAKTNETELKNFFSDFGKVQSCIVNHDKRHAFLKLITHQDAIATKQTVEMLPPDEYRGMFERVCISIHCEKICDSEANNAYRLAGLLALARHHAPTTKKALAPSPSAF
jgi:hypothetical protein